MELELGLKITHTRDDITSTADLRITKDPFGPVFLCRETDLVFILIAHLKGFRRENILIAISKDGNRIVISGEKAVREMVMRGWIMCKCKITDVEIKAFKKVFRIPHVVDLERIKAKYDEQDSTLTIIMKKKVKGMCGVGIEEEEEEEVPKEEVVGKNEAEELAKEEFVEKKKPEEVSKMELIVEEKIQSTEEADEGVEEESSSVESEEKEELQAEAEAVENAIYEELQEQPQQAEAEIVEETTDQVLDAPKEIPEEKAVAPITSPTIFQETHTSESEEVEPQMTDEMPSMEEETEGAAAGQVTQQPQLSDLLPAQAQAQAEAEDQKTASEDDQAEDLTSQQLEEQEDDQEHKMEPEPDQEPKEAQTPTQQQLQNESHKQESDREKETENMVGEMGEETDDQEGEHWQENDGAMDTSPEIDADKGPIEGAAMEEKKHRSKLRKPLMFAGSAFLVSLIVLVINLLRARKR